MPSTPSAVVTGASAGSILYQPLAVRQRIVLPAARRQDEIAGHEIRVVRGHDLADRAAAQHLADLEALGVGSRRAHASAHIGVEREIFVAQEHLARAWLRDRAFDSGEIGGCRFALRMGCERDLPVDALSHAYPPRIGRCRPRPGSGEIGMELTS